MKGTERLVRVTWEEDTVTKGNAGNCGSIEKDGKFLSRVGAKWEKSFNMSALHRVRKLRRRA